MDFFIKQSTSMILSLILMFEEKSFLILVTFGYKKEDSSCPEVFFCIIFICNRIGQRWFSSMKWIENKTKHTIDSYMCVWERERYETWFYAHKKFLVLYVCIINKFHFRFDWFECLFFSSKKLKWMSFCIWTRMNRWDLFQFDWLDWIVCCL